MSMDAPTPPPPPPPPPDVPARPEPAAEAPPEVPPNAAPPEVPRNDAPLEVPSMTELVDHQASIPADPAAEAPPERAPVGQGAISPSAGSPDLPPDEMPPDSQHGPTSQGEGSKTPMEKWEAGEDKVMAQNIAGLREQQDIFRQQGNEQAVRDTEEFIQKLPVSDEIKADPQAYLRSLDAAGQTTDGAPDVGTAEPEVHEGRVDLSQVRTIEPRHRGTDSQGDTTPDVPSEQSTAAADDRTRADVADRVPTGDPRLERVWDSSKSTQSGRSYIHPADVNRESAERIEPTLGEYTVVVHGDPDGFHVLSDEGYIESVSAPEMADLIRSDPDWHSEPIRLVACETGKVPADGSDPPAQQLADELGVEVTAPTELAWEMGGEVWSSTCKVWTDPVTGKRFVSPATGPQRPDGQMKPFQPRS